MGRMPSFYGLLVGGEKQLPNYSRKRALPLHRLTPHQPLMPLLPLTCLPPMQASYFQAVVP
jgi:hypothetical protein